MLFLRIFQETTPDTLDFMLLGFGVIFVVMGIYIFSLFNRSKKLQQDMQNLEDME